MMNTDPRTTLVLLALACACAMAQAAPTLLSIESQALAHWIHYAALNGHLGIDGAALVVEPNGSLRVLRVGLPATSPQPAAARPAVLRLPDPATPEPARGADCTGG